MGVFSGLRHTAGVKRSVTGRLVAAAGAVLIGGLALVVPPAARAADTGMQVVTSTRYTAVPEEKRIAVQIDAVATNITPDPPNGRYFYTNVRFAVQPEIQDLTAESDGTILAATVVSTAAQFSTIEVAFGEAIYHGQSISFRVSFNISDPGGAPQRDVRVASSLVAFPVWAFGSSNTPGSSVTVVIPAGYSVQVEAGNLTSTPGANGTTLLTATDIPDPYGFFAYITAERPGAFTATKISIPLPQGPASVLIRAWQDDPQWGSELAGLMQRGIPVLSSLIGLPFSVQGELTVEEAAASRLGDYAGLYNDTTQTIDIRYDADGYTALHEAAHTWFNSHLFTGRWISEAWAEYYGVAAGRQIGTTGDVFTLTPTLEQAKIPLNDWGTVGSAPTTTEDYAYAASYTLARKIAARTTTAGLQAVWQAASNGDASYQPASAGAPEKGVPANIAGWQRLLDLLEERTHVNYDDLWRTWVVTPAQAAQMDQRVRARADYAATVTAASGWQLPYEVRYTMGAWDFNQAEALLGDANAVLSERDLIARQASALSLSVPPTLQTAFEAGPTFDVAQRDAADELTALAAIKTATATLQQAETPVEWAGLLFENPASRLHAARTAFEAGQATTATGDADAARALRENAADTGRLRVAATGGTLLLLDGLAMGGLALRRRRRRIARARLRPLRAPQAIPNPAARPLAPTPSAWFDAPARDDPTRHVPRRDAPPADETSRDSTPDSGEGNAGPPDPRQTS